MECRNLHRQQTEYFFCLFIKCVMNLLVEIKSARELLMPVHYEIVQQIINRLSKYLSALKICIFHSFLFFSICSLLLAKFSTAICICVPSILIFQQNQKWRCKTDAAICQICHTLTHTSVCVVLWFLKFACKFHCRNMKMYFGFALRASRAAATAF